jgi:hypothetical protein
MDHARIRSCVVKLVANVAGAMTATRLDARPYRVLKVNVDDAAAVGAGNISVDDSLAVGSNGPQNIADGDPETVCWTYDDVGAQHEGIVVMGPILFTGTGWTADDVVDVILHYEDV